MLKIWELAFPILKIYDMILKTDALDQLLATNHITKKMKQKAFTKTDFSGWCLQHKMLYSSGQGSTVTEYPRWQLAANRDAEN